MISYDSLQELADEASGKGKRISALVLEQQSRQSGRSKRDLVLEMSGRLLVMEEAVKAGMSSSGKSPSGLSGGDAAKLEHAMEAGALLGGKALNRVIVKALAVSEVNACMGKIVAAPTAGSCGIIPAVLLSAGEERKIPRARIVGSLFTSGAIGMVIARRACISGAGGGCQAECGSASAMAAGALVELMGGAPEMVAHACAIALKAVMGLICDPVAGLVEVPCIKRNAMGAAEAMVAANLALAGVESAIPADEVIDAMRSVGNAMPPCFRETAEGGLAVSPTGLKIKKRIFGRSGTL